MLLQAPAVDHMKAISARGQKSNFAGRYTSRFRCPEPVLQKGWRKLCQTSTVFGQLTSIFQLFTAGSGVTNLLSGFLE